jgi:hypothetical protein
VSAAWAETADPYNEPVYFNSVLLRQSVGSVASTPDSPYRPPYAQRGTENGSVSQAPSQPPGSTNRPSQRHDSCEDPGSVSSTTIFLNVGEVAGPEAD